MPRLKLDGAALGEIKELALQTFHERRSFNGFDQYAVQQFTILAGLEQYLRKKGFDPQFEVEMEPDQKDFESLED